MTSPSASQQGDGESGSSASDRRTSDFGIVCSHRGESRAVLQHLDRVRRYTDEGFTFRGGFLSETIRVAVVEAGNGFARHRRATEILLREHRPKWVFSSGFSSALDETFQAGDLVLANRLMDTHGNELEVPCRIPPSKRIHVGLCVVADSHPLTVQQKSALRESSGAIAVDTVSLAVAQVCIPGEVRFLSIRAIPDAATEEVPEHAGQLLFAPSSKAWGSAFGGVIKSLRRASVLNDWRQRSSETADHLGKFTCSLMLRITDKLNR